MGDDQQHAKPSASCDVSSSLAAGAETNYFLVGRDADKAILVCTTSDGNAFELCFMPNFSSVCCLFKDKKVFFNGRFSFEINNVFQQSFDNTRTLYTIRDLNEFIEANGGASSDELATFLGGCASRIVVEAPLHLGMDSGDTKKGDGGATFECDSDGTEEPMGRALFKFVKAIVNNFLDWGTERDRYRHDRQHHHHLGTVELLDTSSGVARRASLCVRLRLHVGTRWRWEDHLFDALANNSTGEVLRFVRVPLAAAAHDRQRREAQFVHNDLFIVRCARDELDTLPTDLNALFAPDQFDCHVIAVEKLPAKIANFL